MPPTARLSDWRGHFEALAGGPDNLTRGHRLVGDSAAPHSRLLHLWADPKDTLIAGIDGPSLVAPGCRPLRVRRHWKCRAREVTPSRKDQIDEYQRLVGSRTESDGRHYYCEYASR
ncbi:hypothetical protein GCM10010435_57750 [Winogradskya consettensis]|uniref:Uncharacterized protein n=1 Tax=Winogradskya consettensis TaxID=113560 RepID=A0A919S8I1_9ACTN|nr:hypothetical protein Aco04nite_04570 [Actinoplanes consettensis]